MVRRIINKIFVQLYDDLISNYKQDQSWEFDVLVVKPWSPTAPPEAGKPARAVPVFLDPLEIHI